MHKFIILLILFICGNSNLFPQSEPEIIEVNFPPVKPYGYGSLSGWYGNKKSEHLLDYPIKSQHEQMNRNHVKSGEKWAFLHFPKATNYQTWVVGGTGMWKWKILELDKDSLTLDWRLMRTEDLSIWEEIGKVEVAVPKQEVPYFFRFELNQ